MSHNIGCWLQVSKSIVINPQFTSKERWIEEAKEFKAEKFSRGKEEKKKIRRENKKIPRERNVKKLKSFAQQQKVEDRQGG